MAIRRYVTQTKRRDSNMMIVYHSGTQDDCMYHLSNLMKARHQALYDWARVAEQVYNKDLDQWIDTKVITFRELT